MIHAREDYNRIQDPANLIPENEPVFLLRGQDVCAIAALSAWINSAIATNVDPAMIEAADSQLYEMKAYQAHVKKKVPDL